MKQRGRKNLYTSKRSRMMKRRRTIFLSFIAVLIISVGIFTIVNHNSNKKETVQAQGKEDVKTSENDSSKDNSSKDENQKKDENKKLNNSGYLSLKDDPNADDAKIVAQNTKDLLAGKKTYPVRTDGKKVVYLTFDDGPSTTNTPEVLKVLDKYNVKGTFFIMGKSLEANDKSKDLLKEIAQNGHAIGNHTYSHNYSYLYPNRVMNVDRIISELNKNNNLMKEVLGDDFSTRVIRLPGGYWSWKGREPLKDKMEELDIQNVDWNALNGDAEGKKKDAPQLVSFLKDSVHSLGPNADSVVVLMHDTYGKAETAKALPQIIEYFKDQGFEFRTMK